MDMLPVNQITPPALSFTLVIVLTAAGAMPTTAENVSRMHVKYEQKDVGIRI
jgi:hypothetical protein